MKLFYLAAVPMAACALLAVFPASAQQVISAKSGLVSYFEGQVMLNDQPVEFSTTHFADVKENSIVSTVDGRAEVLLTPGVTLRMGENSSLRMITNRLVDTRLELLSGSAVVEADMIAQDTSVTIVVGQAAIALPKAGLYRFDVSPAQIKVFKGDAEVEMAGQTRVVPTAHMLSLATETASMSRFDTEDTDALDRWSHRRGSYLAAANASAARTLLASGSVPSYFGTGNCSPVWGYNNYLGMMTFIPCRGSLYSPYGYQMYSPYVIGGYYWLNPPAIYGGGGFRTTPSQSGAASLSRPVTSGNYRSTSGAPSVGATRAGFNSSSTAGGISATNSSPSISTNSRSMGSSLGSSSMGSGGFHGGGAGAGAGGGGSRGGGGGHK